MTGFDIPSLGNFDPASLQRALLSAGNARGLVQDPEKVGPRPALTPSAPVRDGEGFAGMLADSLDRVQALQDDTRQKTRGLVLGEDVDLHDVMIAANKSEVAFNLLLEVRNKLVDAWDKLSRSVM